MADDTKAPRKSRKWLRRFVVLVVFALILVWFAPTIAVKSGYVHSLIAKNTQSLNGTLTAGSISLGWLTPIELTNVQISDAQGQPVLIAPAVRGTQSLIDLIRNPNQLGTITVENPKLQVTFTENSTNIEDLLERILKEKASGKLRPELVVKISNGTLETTDGAQTQALDQLDATITFPAGKEPIRIVANRTASLDLELLVSESIVGHVKLSEFSARHIDALIRRFEPGFQASGQMMLDLKGQATFEPEVRVEAEGLLELSQFKLGMTRLGTEELTLAAAHFPFSVKTTPDGIAIQKAELTCDVGTVSYTGTIDPSLPLEMFINQPNQTARADLDIARLARLFPRLIHLKDGTVIESGRIQFDLASTIPDKKTQWDGTIKTSALKGKRNGKDLVWEKPLSVSFLGHLSPDGLPAFDRLNAQADFGQLTGSGTLEQFAFHADVSLDQLAIRLGEFVELQELQLRGTAKLDASAKTQAGVTTLSGDAQFNNLSVIQGGTKFQEPDLKAKCEIVGTFFDSQMRRIDQAMLTVNAGTESAEFRLLKPIPDWKTLENGQAKAKLEGDLERWAKRLSTVVTIPKSIKAIGGQGTMNGEVTLSRDQIALDAITADLKNARFYGYGLKLDEPQLLLDPTTGRIDRKSGLIEFPTLMLRTSTVAASVKPLRIVPQSNGEYGVELEGIANANLSRVQELLQFHSDPQLSDRFGGLVSAGTFKVWTVKDAYHFDGKLPIQQFTLGHPQRPSITEDKLTVEAKGAYNLGDDRLAFDRIVVARADGMSVETKGQLSHLTTLAQVDFEGNLAYDLGTFEPELKKIFGPSFQVKGKDKRKFQFAGILVPTSDKNDPLHGNAAIGWQDLKVYGFDMGPSELAVRYRDPVWAFDPLEATFGKSGKIRLVPTIRSEPGGNELTFEKGKIVDRAQLTPAACADAIGYVLPAFARATEVSGTISFDLGDHRISLSEPEKSTLNGRMTLHEVVVGAGPVISEVLMLTGVKNTSFSLNKDNKPQTVAMKVENGWVYHDNVTLATKSFTMHTSGRVSLDGALEMTIDVPLPDTDIGPLLKNNPKIRESLEKKRIKIPVRGTIARPQLDRQGFRKAVRDVSNEIIRDLGKNALGGLLDKIAPPPKK